MNAKSFHVIAAGVGVLLIGIALGVGALATFAAPDATPSLAPVGTAFTYQGYIEGNGSPANGSFNLRFSLYDDPASGTLIAGPLTEPSVNVVDGLFTVTLDFGGVFDGTACWVLVEVQGPGDPGFTALSPRQPLTTVPYAVHADSSVLADKVDGHDVGPRTSYVNIPGSGFEGIQHGMTFDSGGDWVIAYADGYPNSVFTAAVNLPHGAQITKLTFYWRDQDPRPVDPDWTISGQGTLELRRTYLPDRSDQVMAYAASEGSSGYGSSYDDTIEYGTIDNSAYIYYLVLKIPLAVYPESYWVAYNAAVIEYTEVGIE